MIGKLTYVHQIQGIVQILLIFKINPNPNNIIQIHNNVMWD